MVLISCPSARPAPPQGELQWEGGWLEGRWERGACAAGRGESSSAIDGCLCVTRWKPTAPRTRGIRLQRFEPVPAPPLAAVEIRRTTCFVVAGTPLCAPGGLCVQIHETFLAGISLLRPGSARRKRVRVERFRQEPPCSSRQGAPTFPLPRATGGGNKDGAAPHRAAILALRRSHCQAGIGRQRPIP